MPVRFALTILLVAAGCRLDSDDPDTTRSVDVTVEDGAGPVSVYGDGSLPTDAEVEAARFVGRGRDGLAVDTAAIRAAARANRETLGAIDSTADWRPAGLTLPLGGDVAGPSVLKVQTMLDRAGFSPGQIDGRWGDNTELAVAWLQQAAGLPATGLVDEATARALAERAGRPAQLITLHRLTADDVQGPFATIPSDIYEQAELERLGYESLSEKLGERFHSSPALLVRLNPGRSLDSLAAGDTLRVPNLAGAPRPSGTVSRLVVSGAAGYLHALSADGSVLFHAPITLGSEYDPSPEGDLRITSVTRNPSWHYQPALLSGVDDSGENATIPPGPNNAVGTVWMALSKPHYGIHGTKAPGTIGTATSSGCVRLTNWDAERLAGMVRAGTPVRFRDVAGRRGAGAAEGDDEASARAGRQAPRADSARTATRQTRDARPAR